MVFKKMPCPPGMTKSQYLANSGIYPLTHWFSKNQRNWFWYVTMVLKKYGICFLKEPAREPQIVLS